MHPLEITAWTARLGHLLITERYGFSHVRFPGDVPAATRSRTARHLAMGGPDAIEALTQAWPASTTLPIWPDFQRALIHRPPGPPLGPMARRGFIEPPILPSDGPKTRLAQLLRRLAYLHDEEEFQGTAFGLLTLSEAWRACMHDIVNPLGNLLEFYLDCRSATLRTIVRFCLHNQPFIRLHRATDDWRAIDDRALFERFAAAMDRQPESLACAPPEQIERLQRAGALRDDFSLRSPSWLAEDEGYPLPLARVPSAHFDLHPLPEPALVTMSPVLECAALHGSGPAPRRSPTDHDGDWSPTESGAAVDH